jgi:hypothetical protein
VIEPNSRIEWKSGLVEPAKKYLMSRTSSSKGVTETHFVPRFWECSIDSMGLNQKPKKEGKASAQLITKS